MGSSNAVALDFGRTLFGSIGGVVFAVCVAVSCFGALNGNTSFSQSFHCLLKTKRFNIYVCATHPSCRTRWIPPRYVWQTEQIAKDTSECHSSTNHSDDRVHRRWGWVPISGQLFGGSVLVILLFNCAWVGYTAGQRAGPQEVRLPDLL